MDRREYVNYRAAVIHRWSVSQGIQQGSNVLGMSLLLKQWVSAVPVRCLVRFWPCFDQNTQGPPRLSFGIAFPDT